MNRRYLMPTASAWNFVSFGLMWFPYGCGVSVVRATSYQLELMQYIFGGWLGSRLSRAGVEHIQKSVELQSDRPESTTRSGQSDSTKRDRRSDQVKQDIEDSTKKVIKLETEK